MLKQLNINVTIGAEMENNQRKIRQNEGIQLAKIRLKYRGRKKGAKTAPSDINKIFSDMTLLATPEKHTMGHNNCHNTILSEVVNHVLDKSEISF